MRRDLSAHLVVATGLVLAASCGQGGCTVATHPFAPDGGNCVFVPLRFERFLALGEEATVEFGVDERCHVDIQEGVFQVPFGATAEVLDPAGAKIALSPIRSERRLIGASHFHNIAKVTFTPDRPGEWTLNAEFGTRIGATRQTVSVVRSRSDAVARVVNWTPPQACIGFDVTGAGTVLCLDPTDPMLPTVVTSGGQSLVARSLAVNGNDVWLLVSKPEVGKPGVRSYVERWVDDGTALALINSLGPVELAAGAIAAKADEALLFTGPTKESGGFSFDSVSPLGDGGIASHAMALTGLGTAAAIVSGPAGTLLWAEGAILGQFQFAELESDGGVLPKSQSGPLAGADKGALWFGSLEADERGESHDVAVVSVAGDSVARARLELPRGVFFFVSRNARLGTPVLPVSKGSTTMVVPTVSEGRILLESFDAGLEFLDVSTASRTHAFARSRDGKSIKVFAR